MALLGSKKKADAASGKDAAAQSKAKPAKPERVVKEKKARPAKGPVKKGTVVGLNIGNATIKAVEVTAKNGELSVTRLASIATPPEAFQNGNVLSASGLAGAIKALWKAGGFKGRAVVSSVAGTGALVVRVIEVPFMSDSQLADTMAADAQLYIPFPPTEVQMDWKALRELPTDPDSGTMDVLLAAAQTEIIDAHIKVLQSARLDPRAVDVEPIAAGRTLSLQKRGDFNGLMVDYNEITAIANIGALGTEISLLRGDVLVFTRTVSTGGNSISQGIADALNVPFVEGERIKIEQGDALPPEGYQTGQVGDDDFGFGDAGASFGGGENTFGGDFDDFGLSDTPAPSPGAATAPNRTTVLDAPATVSTDPFDLDFFNQGPKNEPGGGHAQKENQPNPFSPPAAPISFDEEDLSLLPGAVGASAPEVPTAAAPAATGVPGFTFDFDSSPDELPSVADSPAPVAATPAPFNFGDDDLQTEILPSMDAAPVAAPTTPIAPMSTAPIPAPPVSPSSSMSSAFDFSDFDLPATAQSGATLAGSAPIGPASSLPAPTPPLAGGAFSQPKNVGFSFDEVSDLTPTVMTPPATVPEASAPAESAGASIASGLAVGAGLGAVAGAAAGAAALGALGATAAQGAATTGAIGAAGAGMTLGDEGVPLVESVSVAGADSLGAPTFFEAPPAAFTPAPENEEFDMSDIFGSTEAAGTPTSSTEAGGMSFEDFNLGDGSPTGLDVAGVGGVDDFAFGVDDADFGGFGVGLSAGENAEAAAVYEALAQPIEELASEISRSLSFYLERVPDAALSRIYLTGGGALLKNLDVFLTGRLGAPTAVLNPLQLLPVAAQSEIPNGPLYTVALGLALRDFVD